MCGSSLHQAYSVVIGLADVGVVSARDWRHAGILGVVCRAGGLEISQWCGHWAWYYGIGADGDWFWRDRCDSGLSIGERASDARLRRTARSARCDDYGPNRLRNWSYSEGRSRLVRLRARPAMMPRCFLLRPDDSKARRNCSQRKAESAAMRDCSGWGRA